MTLKQLPDAKGYFGEYGGRFVPDTLMAPLLELESAYDRIRHEQDFQDELATLQRDFIGRPTAFYFAEALTKRMGGAQIYLKREDNCHTGAHKINNAVGQILLAKRMGKKRIIAETGAGQHGVATAAAAAHFGMECVVYMGAEDMKRQAPNVYRMRLLGAEVVPVEAGTKTLKDAVSEAMRDWVTNVRTTYYLLGSALGPHPYPQMVRDFQAVIGIEARAQCLEATGQLPDQVVACVGGGSNAIGVFHAFLDDEGVELIGVEAAGEGVETGRHAARFSGGRAGIFQGMKTFVLQTNEGQIQETASVSAGLDYAGVGPEHANLLAVGRAKYAAATDTEALNAFEALAKCEGIIPALESSHGLAYGMTAASQLSKDQIVLINLSGRGDKDMGIVQNYGK